MTTLLAFLLAIGVLVTFHEYGHYLAARLMGVRVLRFSVGFGRPLLRVVRGGTEWCVAAIPLGGYVKMLDEREGEVDPAERHLAFNNKPVWQRMVIVLAGPLANLLLAILLYFVVFLPGVEQLRANVGTVAPQSAAAAAGVRAGDRVSAVNGVAVANWQEVNEQVTEAIGSAGHLELAVVRDVRTLTLPVDLARFDLDTLDEKSFGRLGIMPARYLPVVAQVLPDGAGARGGLKAGDRLLSVDGQPASWEALVDQVHRSPGRELVLGVERAGQPLTLRVRPDTVERDGVKTGRIGVAPQVDRAWLDGLSYRVDLGVAGSLRAAAVKTWRLSASSLKMLWGMVAGQVSWQAISGPLTIADYAGRTASMGWLSYLEFLALISVSLGVLNLLPIPVLDGGHFMYYTAELIKGSPLSVRTQELGQRLGLALIIALMMIALFNDLGRLLGG